MRIDLPGGHWAVLVEPMEVTEGQVRPLRAAQMRFREALRPPPEPGHILPDEDPDKSPLDYMDADQYLSLVSALERATTAFCVESWDFDGEPTEDSIANIPVVCFTALRTATASIVRSLFPNNEDSPHSADLMERLVQSYTQDPKVRHLLELPDWVDETQRLVDLIEFTHWSVATIDATPVVVLDRIVADVRARHRARAKKQEEAFKQ